jgi:hypothetical protein
MSRIFRAYQPYHHYDACQYEQVNQTPRYLQVTICGNSKDGKASKDPMIRNFWYKSKSKIFPDLPSIREERISS